MTFAQKLVRAAAQAEGSQTLQIAVQGEPMLVSACVRTNPLFMAESVDGLVRVTASTYNAVAMTFKAMGVDIPFEEKTYEKTKKGKTVTHVGRSDVIYRLNEGDVIAWLAGEHAESHITLAEPTKRRYAQQASSYAYAAGAAQPKFHVGDIVRRTLNGELYVMLGINRVVGKPLTYRCEGVRPDGTTEFITLEEYQVKLHQPTKQGMTLQQDRDALKNAIFEDDLAHAALDQPSAVATSDVKATATLDAQRNPLTRQAALTETEARNLAAASRPGGTGGATAAERFWIERCELCGVESTSVSTFEDVDLCSTCLSQIRRDESLGWISA